VVVGLSVAALVDASFPARMQLVMPAGVSALQITVSTLLRSDHLRAMAARSR
jgi:hypothetical protein